MYRLVNRFESVRNYAQYIAADIFISLFGTH